VGRGSGLAVPLGVDETFGLHLPIAQQLAYQPVVGDGTAQLGGVLRRHLPVHQLAGVHVPPLEVRSMACGAIGCAGAARPAAHFRTLKQRTRTQVVDAAQRLADARDALPGLLGDGLRSTCSHAKVFDKSVTVVNTNDNMRCLQVPTQHDARFSLHSERLGPLPLINAFLQRMGLEALLEKYIPTTDRRNAVSHAQALGVLLRSIIVEREPVYRQQETVCGFAPGLFGVSAQAMERLPDDRIGRALDRLFDADRGGLPTQVAVAVGQRFGVSFERLHNDSTSIAFCGQYRAAKGRALRGRSAPAIVYGFGKDHRPDLKQLLFILSVTADGVPASFRCADGNTGDSVTHIETWNTLCAVAGRTDFLYVVD